MSKKEKKIYLIDGTAFAFRAFYAIRELRDPQGKPTNAIFGFTRMLMRFLKDDQPDYIAVSFDTGAPTFRHEAYPEYKANRKAAPEELTCQFPKMREVVESLRIPIVMKEGFEADDLLGTLARMAEEEGLCTVIYTNDKDALQLVNETVTVYDPHRAEGVVYTPDKVCERLNGLRPDQVVDMLALAGDSSDNIPGIPGIGMKTAQDLLNKYGTIEGIYENLDQISGKKRRENLEKFKDQAFLGRRLALIKTDSPVDVSIEDCVYRVPDRDRLVNLFRELGFFSLVADYSEETKEERHYQVIRKQPEFQEFVEALKERDVFAIDTETTSRNPHLAKLVGISVAWEPLHAFYIPVGHIQPDATNGSGGLVSDQLPLDHVLKELKPILESRSHRKVGQNIKYDAIIFRRNGVDLAPLHFDTMIAAYLANPSRSSKGIDALSLEYLGLKKIPTSQIIGSGRKATTMDRVEIDAVGEYACEDADVTWRLYEILRERLDRDGLDSLFEEVEMPLVEVLVDAELAGAALDVKFLAQLADKVNGKLLQLTEDIHRLAGREFNLNSTQQVGDILFNQLELPVVKKTKTGFSTDMEVLGVLAEQHELPARLLEYRGLEKIRSTYVEALPKLVNPETGRLHTSFHQTVAETGRLSSTEPNLQNIPIRTELGREVRRALIPRAAGRSILSADYSQIELRVLAHLSGDEALIVAFQEDTDIHTRTAARIFGLDEDAVSPDLRSRAKAVNFGIIYGMSPYGLSRAVGIQVKEAEAFIDQYFELYPGVKAFLDRTLAEGRENGYVSTLLGRRRYLPDLNSSDRNVRRNAERAAVNAPVQGSAADIIKIAMVRLYDRLEEEKLEADLILQVHDELVLDVPDKEREEVIDIVLRSMQEAYPLRVPLKVDARFGPNWLEAH